VETILVKRLFSICSQVGVQLQQIQPLYHPWVEGLKQAAPALVQANRRRLIGTEGGGGWGDPGGEGGLPTSHLPKEHTILS